MRTRLLCLALVIAAPALAGVTDVTDGTCVHTPEPILADLSSFFASLPAPPTPVPLTPEVLAQMDANAATKFPLSKADRRSIDGHQTLAVPGSYQKDGTCMFRALRMVSMYWRSTGHDTEAIPVDDWSGQQPRGDSLAYAHDVLGIQSPKTMGIGTSGAIAVAEHYGYETVLTKNATMRDVEKAIAAGTPPIVSFYCCDEGKPTAEQVKLADGSVAPYWHAGVVEGIDHARGVVLVKHSWNRKEPFVVPISQFMASFKLAGAELLVVKPKKYGEKK